MLECLQSKLMNLEKNDIAFVINLAIMTKIFTKIFLLHRSLYWEVVRLEFRALSDLFFLPKVK